MIPNEALADELIARLNLLLKDSAAKAAVAELIRARVPAEGLEDHPTIQVWEDGSVTFLGMLNGLVGTIHGGQRDGWGMIAVRIEQDGELVRFERTAEPGE